jgi:hypothetical protein
MGVVSVLSVLRWYVVYVTKKPRFGFERGFEQLPVRLCSRHRSRAVRAGRRRRLVQAKIMTRHMRAIALFVKVRKGRNQAQMSKNTVSPSPWIWNWMR